MRNIDKTSIVYSFGIGEDISFDLAVINAFGLTVHAFDPIPKSITWVRKQNLPSRFVLHDYGLAEFVGTIQLYPPENPEHVSYSVVDRIQTNTQAIAAPVKRLETIMKELGYQQIDILKIDIEGSGYAVIEDLQTCPIRPQQFLVEFHHRFPGVGLPKPKLPWRSCARCGTDCSLYQNGEKSLASFVLKYSDSRAARRFGTIHYSIRLIHFHMKLSIIQFACSSKERAGFGPALPNPTAVCKVG